MIDFSNVNGTLFYANSNSNAQCSFDHMSFSCFLLPVHRYATPQWFEEKVHAVNTGGMWTIPASQTKETTVCTYTENGPKPRYKEAGTRKNKKKINK